MKWEQEDIVEYLINDYILHYRHYHHHQDNDNEVDANWETAVCDYIFDLLQKITGATPTDVADIIDDKMEGCFLFNPQDNPYTYGLQVGTKVCICQDILYSDYDSFCSTFDEDEVNYLLENVVEVSGDNVYIPKGTHMIFKGVEPGGSGWPTFTIHDFEFDFAGDPIKIKIVK